MINLLAALNNLATITLTTAAVTRHVKTQQLLELSSETTNASMDPTRVTQATQAAVLKVVVDQVATSSHAMETTALGVDALLDPTPRQQQLLPRQRPLLKVCANKQRDAHVVANKSHA